MQNHREMCISGAVSESPGEELLLIQMFESQWEVVVSFETNALLVKKQLEH